MAPWFTWANLGQEWVNDLQVWAQDVHMQKTAHCVEAYITCFVAALGQSFGHVLEREMESWRMMTILQAGVKHWKST